MEVALQRFFSVDSSAESEVSERRWVNVTLEMGSRIVEGWSLGNGEVMGRWGLVSMDQVNGRVDKVWGN
jgi:hypothetical protein